MQCPVPLATVPVSNSPGPGQPSPDAPPYPPTQQYLTHTLHRQASTGGPGTGEAGARVSAGACRSVGCALAGMSAVSDGRDAESSGFAPLPDLLLLRLVGLDLHPSCWHLGLQARGIL